MGGLGIVMVVVPSDRGHFNYTVHVASELNRRGYDVEYYSPATARAYAPAFADFFPLTAENDDTFDRFTKIFVDLASKGSDADTHKSCDEVTLPRPAPSALSPIPLAHSAFSLLVSTTKRPTLSWGQTSRRR